MANNRIVFILNCIKDKKIMSLIVIIYAILFLPIFAADVKGTHLSKPIINMDKTSFKANEEITVEGWVDYFGPTSDVLLDILIRAPNGNIANIHTVKSDSFGNYSFTFRQTNITSSGKYTVQVISQCRDEHRDICTNESNSIPIIIKSAASSKMLNTITQGVLNSSKMSFPFNHSLGERRASNGINVTQMNFTQEQNNPIINCTKLKVNVQGTQKSDVLTGTNGNDVIDALDGNDIIYGLDGNDIICGGGGDDLIFTGLGNDKVDGGEGNDQIYGGYGYDVLDGGEGNDQIYGGYGYDVLDGGEGNDTIDGGPGYNQCFEAELIHSCR
jgi:hypothetical protein